jgi:uncharacterized protein YqeY
MTQLKLDFSGKQDERITFAAPKELKLVLEYLQKKLKRNNISALAKEYVIECATRDLGKIMILESRGEKHFVDLP